MGLDTAWRTVPPPPAGPATAGERPAADAVDRALHLAVLAWTAGWLALIPWLGGPQAPLDWAVFLVACGAWAATAVQGPRCAPALVAVLTVAALLHARAVNPTTLLLDLDPVLTWVILATVAAALTFGRRAGPVLVVAIGIAAAVVMTTVAVDDQLWDAAWRQVAAVTAFALADGLAAATGAAALRRAADATDTSARELSQAEQQRAARLARRERILAAQRLLHDTVVNTLGVVRRGVADDRIPALRERCRSDVHAVAALWGRREGRQSWTAGQILDAVTTRAAALGITVRRRDVDVDDAPVPAAVAAAVVSASGEAVLNAAKHAEVAAVDVHLSWTGERLAVIVRDDGRGWSGASPTGRGIDVAIRQPSAAAGVSADLATAPGAGTTLTLRWQAPPPRHDAAGPPLGGDSAVADRAIARAATGVAGWIVALCLTLTALAWPQVPSAGSVVALIVMLAVLGLGWLAARGDLPVPAPVPVAVLLVAAVALVVVLPANDVAGCGELAVGWWGSDGGLALLIMVTALTRAKGWVVAAVVVFVAAVWAYPLGSAALSGDCAGLPMRLLAQELAVFAAMLLLREQQLRLWGQARRNRSAMQDHDVAEASRAASERADDVRVDTVLDAAVPLLSGIGAGELDPHDPAVRRRSATAEESLRSLLRLGPDPSGLAEELADAVVAGFRSGCALVLTTVPRLDLPCPSGVGAWLESLLTGLPAGERVTAAVLTDPDTVTLVITCTAASACARPGRAIGDNGVVTDTTIVGEQRLNELRWQR